jgi:hypothetical protein
MARVIPRSGRREANKPVFSRELLQTLVSKVLEREGVSFSETGKSFEAQCWRLFKALQFLIPAVVVASGLPVSLYGVGSYRLVLSGGKPKFRCCFPKGIFGSVFKSVKAPKAAIGRRAVFDRFWRALDLFLVQERGIESPLQADYFEFDFDD